jgi:biopolymer transport protein ExbB/TolQ
MTTDTSSVPEVTSPLAPERFQLHWTRRDFEQRLGFRGGRFTAANKTLAFLIGALLTVAFYGAIMLVARQWPQTRWFTAMFLERGICPYPTMLFFFWALAILFLKSRKLGLQMSALDLAAVPQQPDFVLTPSSARTVLDRIHTLVDSTSHFVLLNRVERALSNLHNMGQVGDVAQMLKTQAEHDEEQVASSYTLVQGLTWAIPVLGFIGTVLGLSQAIAAFSGAVTAGKDFSLLKESLGSVTAGLATAFETTLVALVAALIIQLRSTMLQSRESEFLDSCNDYCHAHIASKLRLHDNA